MIRIQVRSPRCLDDLRFEGPASPLGLPKQFSIGGQRYPLATLQWTLGGANRIARNIPENHGMPCPQVQRLWFRPSHSAVVRHHVMRSGLARAGGLAVRPMM